MKLDVSLNQIPIGTLAQKNQKIYFEYDANFLKSNIQISPYKLPLKSGVQRCDDYTFGGIWGVFADSLPDGWGRLLVDRHLMKLGINPASVSILERLAFVGNGGMGALSYKPSKKIDSGFGRVVLDDLAQSSNEILEGSSEYMLEELLALSGSSAGARPKVLVQISDDKKEIVSGNQKLKSGFSDWIVKFASSSDSRDIGAVEYAYSIMAKNAGISMSETALLEGKKSRYFAIKRFDRAGDKRVHMHSLAGLVHVDFRFPTLDYEDVLKLTLHLSKSYKDLEMAFRLACFNLFAHNRDDHAKNFSFLMDESGNWSFSPAYDLTFSFGPGGEHSTLYLGEGKNPTQKQLLELAKKFNIKNALQTIEQVKEAVSSWEKIAKELDISKTTIKSIKNYTNLLT